MDTQGLQYTAQLGECPDTAFQVVRFDLTESLSAPFELTLELASADEAITAEQVLDRPALFAIWRDGEPERQIDGIVAHFTRADQGHHHTFYSAVIRPPLHRLSLTRNTRIFEHQALPDILTTVLEERGIRDFALALREDPPAREFRLQYRESDLAFAERILAEGGIDYRFESNGERLQPVFEDDPRQAPDLGEVLCHLRGGGRPDQPHIRRFSVCHRSVPASARFKGYDWRRPAYPAEHHAERVPEHQREDYEHYDRLGAVGDDSEAQRLTRARLKALQSEAVTGEGEGSCIDFSAGCQFRLTEHELDDANTDWRLVRVRHSGTQSLHGESETTYSNDFRAVPAGEHWLPQRPVPPVDSPQIARVVGPDNESIHCDEQGRVRVRFSWERGPADEHHNRAWLRVSQSHAGGGFGQHQLPRVGHEVLVSFLDDDPDQPIITGELHHATNVHPWSLPEHKARSGLRTRTHNGEGYNELHFDDSPEAERIHLHAQRDLALHIGQDRVEQIDNDQHLSVAGSRYTSVEGDDHQHHQGNDNRRTGGDLHQDTGGAAHTHAGGAQLVEAGQEIHHSAGMKVVIEAGAEITLEAGGSFLKVDPSGVILSGPAIKMNSGGAAGAGSGVSLRAPEPARQMDAESGDAAEPVALGEAEQRAAHAGGSGALKPVPTNASGGGEATQSGQRNSAGGGEAIEAGQLNDASAGGQMLAPECGRQADGGCELEEDCRCG